MSSRSEKAQKQTISSAQRDVIFFRERDAERAANAAKTERLRALRLAKEAQDRAAAELAASQKPASKPKVKPRAG